MKKQKSLRKRVEYAQRRERDAKRRMEYLAAEKRALEIENRGAVRWFQVMASMLGDDFVVTAEQIEQGKHREYVCQLNPDGSVRMFLSGLESDPDTVQE